MGGGIIVDPFTLEGWLTPESACTQMSHHFTTLKRGTDVYIKEHSVKLKFKKEIGSSSPSDLAIRSAILNVTATLDGQFFLSGQVVQAAFQHPALRRGEGEAVLTTRPRMTRVVTDLQLSAGIMVGRMAESVPPLAHALRDFRIAVILPPEDGAPFLWRSLESILWLLADEHAGKADREANIKSVAAKLGVDPDLFIQVKNSVNDQYKFARHGSKRYRDRLIWLKKLYKREDPPLFTEKIFKFGESAGDIAVDIFPFSFSDEEWTLMWQSTWKVLHRFVPFLWRYTLGQANPPWL